MAYLIVFGMTLFSSCSLESADRTFNDSLRLESDSNSLKLDKDEVEKNKKQHDCASKNTRHFEISEQIKGNISWYETFFD